MNAQQYEVVDGILAGELARIVEAPVKAYKPHPEDYPDPVWVVFKNMPPQWFPRGRLKNIELV